MKDEPPRIVVSIKAGEIPRYSASARPEMRLCAVAQRRPSTSRKASPQSPSARWMPCAIRSIALISLARPDRIPRPRRSRQNRVAARPSRRHHWHEYRVGRILSSGTVYAEPDAHADTYSFRCDVLDPAHQPEAFVAIDQGDVVRRALARMRDRRRVDRAEPGAQAPFETVAAGKGTDDAGVKHRPFRVPAPLIGQLTLFEVRLINRQR